MVHIKNALVVVVGIGDYDGNMPNLIGIPKDYKNLISTFYKVFGYSVLFLDKNNQLHYCNKKPNQNYGNEKNTIIKQTKLKSDKFKIKWTSDEIDDFFDKAQEIWTNTDNKGQLIHDSLLVFISCHGDMEGVILDSDCEEIPLASIFAQFWGAKCPQMLDKPKVFFVDACRGSMRSRIKVNSTNASNKNTLKSSVEIDVDLYENSPNKNDNKTTSMTHNVSIIVENIPNLTTASLDSNAFGKHGSDMFRGQRLGGIAIYRGRKMSTDTETGTRRMTSLRELFHSEANCRIIYANPEGYAAVDAGDKGGYLIQAVKHVFNKKGSIENENLDSIVNQIRFKTRQLVGKGTMENVEDVNRMNFNVYFSIV